MKYQVSKRLEKNFIQIIITKSRVLPPKIRTLLIIKCKISHLQWQQSPKLSKRDLNKNVEGKNGSKYKILLIDSVKRIPK